MKEVSVQEALHEGKKRLEIPFIVALFLSFSFLSFLFVFNAISFLWLILLMPTIFIVPYYLLSREYFQWQIWAFENVRNVHELKEKAIQWGLISSWEEKFLKPSPMEKAALDRLQRKFEQPDDFIDDLNVPPIVQVYYSQGYNKFQLFMWSLLFLATTYAAIGLMLRNLFHERRG
jgi:hypothetical protein